MAKETKAAETAEEVKSAAAEETQNEAAEAEETAEEADKTEEAEAAEGEDRKDKPLFGKKKKEKTDKRDERIAELEDIVKRQLAEFENFRRRSEQEKNQQYTMGAKSVIEKMLPVVDNFERGLATLTPEQVESDPFAQGIDQIYRQLMKQLEDMGVKPIEAVGKEMDPAFHNAVMQVESEEYESGVVAQELQKGYTYRDTVVRHSMVAVAQ